MKVMEREPGNESKKPACSNSPERQHGGKADCVDRREGRSCNPPQPAPGYWEAFDRCLNVSDHCL